MFSVIAIIYGFNKNWLKTEIDIDTMSKLAAFNIFISFFTATSFIIVVLNESVAKEKRIKKMLKEKEVLLAEIFHHVKK